MPTVVNVATSERRPSPPRHAADDPLTARCPALERGEAGRHMRLVQKDQAVGIDHRLLDPPPGAGIGILLAGELGVADLRCIDQGPDLVPGYGRWHQDPALRPRRFRISRWRLMAGSVRQRSTASDS